MAKKNPYFVSVADVRKIAAASGLSQQSSASAKWRRRWGMRPV